MIDVTVVIPTIPKRRTKLNRAFASVLQQTHPARAVIVQTDHDKEGSAQTRNRALGGVATEWVAFLDDDDEFLPWHLEILSKKIQETGADVAYGLPRVIDARGRVVKRQWDWGGPEEFDGELLKQQSYINICSVVRTKNARQVGGFEFIRGARTGQLNDDHGFYLRLYNSGSRFAHVHEETFIWNHHGNNTSGQPTKGDAR